MRYSIERLERAGSGRKEKCFEGERGDGERKRLRGGKNGQEKEMRLGKMKR